MQDLVRRHAQQLLHARREVVFLRVRIPFPVALLGRLEGPHRAGLLGGECRLRLAPQGLLAGIAQRQEQRHRQRRQGKGADQPGLLGPVRQRHLGVARDDHRQRKPLQPVQGHQPLPAIRQGDQARCLGRGIGPQRAQHLRRQQPGGTVAGAVGHQGPVAVAVQRHRDIRLGCDLLEVAVQETGIGHQHHHALELPLPVTPVHRDPDGCASVQVPDEGRAHVERRPAALAGRDEEVQMRHRGAVPDLLARTGQAPTLGIDDQHGAEHRQRIGAGAQEVVRTGTGRIEQAIAQLGPCRPQDGVGHAQRAVCLHGHRRRQRRQGLQLARQRLAPQRPQPPAHGGRHHQLDQHHQQHPTGAQRDTVTVHGLHPLVLLPALRRQIASAICDPGTVIRR